ncbi:MAG TPA: RtcB family protein [Enhygromyxa sp.]|nr:RtcB family protein [Enhygromyxa sp.]
MSTTYEVDNIEGAVPVKRWTKGVAVEDAALRQLANVARLPFIHKWVAAMPDVHWGMGATVGSVIPTKGAIVPAAVGVDLGCGMMAIETSLRAEDLPDNLAPVRAAIERAVPRGRTGGGHRNDRGAWSDVPKRVGDRWSTELAARFSVITGKHRKIADANHLVHLGTLGTGNHFIELCLDERDHVWVMLHSGSRGIGNRIGSYFIALAREEMQRWFVRLPDENLAYLPEGTEHFDDYVEAVGWAQDFARINRELMMAAVISALEQAPGLRPFVTDAMAVNCHHNYVAREHHYGANVWVTRKGAVRAGEGELGIIPGSMGAKSFIVRGKGNPESFCSCSHGAGRAMSRSEARKRFSLADHAEATKHVECRKDEAVIDETPAAYKPIEAVMAAQADLVEVVHELRQVVCVKG